MKATFQIILRIFPIFYKERELYFMVERTELQKFQSIEITLKSNASITATIKGMLDTYGLHITMNPLLFNVEEQESILLIDYIALSILRDFHAIPSEFSLLSTKELEANLNKEAVLFRKCDLALKKLAHASLKKPIFYYLMPPIFSIPELYVSVQKIVGMDLNRGNFYRKVDKLPFLKKENSTITEKGKRTDFYKFELDLYEKFLERDLLKF